jgi:hypothetical protein
MTTFIATRLSTTTAVTWVADHRVRLTCAAVGAALVGLGVLVDIRETRGAEPGRPAPADGLAAVTPAASSAAAPAVAPLDTAASAFRMPPLNQYGEVVERPLFSPDRRAHQQARTVAATPPLPFTLRGIIVQSNVHYALIEEGSPGSPAVSKRLTEGQSIGGGTVKEILRDRIVVNMNGGETVIRLFDPSTTDGKHTPVLPAGGNHPSRMLPPESAMGHDRRPPTSGG